MFGTALSFTTPLALSALILLPIIWWLLRLLPPSPQKQDFPPTRLLAEIEQKEETPHSSPWWLTALRLLLAALFIAALAGPYWQPAKSIKSSNSPLLLVIDNGWTSTKDWQKRLDLAKQLIQTKISQEQPVALLMTASLQNKNLSFTKPEKALEQLDAQRPQPFIEDRQQAETIIKHFIRNHKDIEAAYIASQLALAADGTFIKTLENAASFSLYHQEGDRLAITHIDNKPDFLNVHIKKLHEEAHNLTLIALDEKGLPLAQEAFSFDKQKRETVVKIDLPLELRNDIYRLQILNGQQIQIPGIGSHFLIDSRNRRRSVGLLSGVSKDISEQPLLSPLYYISRALEPFAQLRDAKTANITKAIPNLLESGISMLVMADIGTIPEKEVQRLENFMEKGGTVVRFAGPRLAKTGDPLTPVRLRKGERNLSGSLTWEEPQKLARFSKTGPFAGLPLPDDIEILRQVLAEPDFDLNTKTWAELEDGTPLVTGEQRGKGFLVLFHVTADATWSNLPLSGAFVDMLNKLTSFSANQSSQNNAASSTEEAIFPPYLTLNAQGTLTAPLATAEPLKLSSLDTLPVNSTHPPGFYGKKTGLLAHNLMKKETPFEPANFNTLISGKTHKSDFNQENSYDLRPVFFILAFILLLVDSLIVAFMSGFFSFQKTIRLKTDITKALPVFFVLLLSTATLLISQDTQAQDRQNQNSETPDYAATFTTRLAYVITGDNKLDDISAAGLQGLSNYLTRHTALEPGPPVGLDIKSDELSFYALIYWPISAQSTIPDAATMARIDAFMKQGGSILFDTRDQIDLVIDNNSKANRNLRSIVRHLDIPPLEPVPSKHVLTRSFYLLQDFPGRWMGSPLWVEATNQKSEESSEGNLGKADGVSSILITANDLAGAWAIDEAGQPLLPVSPGGNNQRIYAFRTGVNIIMYSLTGNYKADQVHIPALLERLGQ